MRSKHLLLAILFMSISFSSSAQISRDSELYQQLRANDRLLFNDGFNSCDLNVMASLITDDLEFYHDKSGVTKSKAEFLEVMKNGICKSDAFVSRRAVIEASLKVFPLYDGEKLYGAIQEGVHRFFETPKGQPEREGNAARFTHLWLLQKDGNWKISRVISYDHNLDTSTASELVEKRLAYQILIKYVGTYQAPKTGDVTFTIKGERLHLSANNMEVELAASTNNLFFSKDAPLTFEFVNNEQGEVSKCIVRENGAIVEEAIRVEE